jgi:hypothetical protein
MSELEQRLREIETRIAALESRKPKSRRKRPRPDSGEIAERHQLWSEYVEAEMKYGHGRAGLTRIKSWFAAQHNLQPWEFYRFFSANDKRGIPRDSGPYQRIRAEILSATAALKNSHGNGAVSHLSRTASPLSFTV